MTELIRQGLVVFIIIIIIIIIIIREKTRPSCIDYNPFILGTSAIVIIEISITFKKWYMLFWV